MAAAVELQKTKCVVDANTFDARYLSIFLKQGRIASTHAEMHSMGGHYLWREHETLVEDTEKLSANNVTLKGGCLLFIKAFMFLAPHGVHASLCALFDKLKRDDLVAELNKHQLTGDNEGLYQMFRTPTSTLRWEVVPGTSTLRLTQKLVALVAAHREVLQLPADNDHRFVQHVVEQESFKCGLLVLRKLLSRRFASEDLARVQPYLHAGRADIFVTYLFLRCCPQLSGLMAFDALRSALLDLGDAQTVLDCFRRATAAKTDADARRQLEELGIDAGEQQDLLEKLRLEVTAVQQQQDHMKEDIQQLQLHAVPAPYRLLVSDYLARNFDAYNESDINKRRDMAACFGTLVSCEIGRRGLRGTVAKDADRNVYDTRVPEHIESMHAVLCTFPQIWNAARSGDSRDSRDGFRSAFSQELLRMPSELRSHLLRDIGNRDLAQAETPRAREAVLMHRENNLFSIFSKEVQLLQRLEPAVPWQDHVASAFATASEEYEKRRTKKAEEAAARAARAAAKAKAAAAKASGAKRPRQV